MFGTVNSSSSSAVFSWAVSVLLLASCVSSNDRSGDCFYDYVETHAEVIEMKPSKDGNILVILDFKGSKLSLEDQELGALKDMTIDHDFLVRNNIEIGNQYEVTVSEITKGSCTPIFVSFNHNLE